MGKGREAVRLRVLDAPAAAFPAPTRTPTRLCLLSLALLGSLPGCAGPRAVPAEAVSPRLHHLLDLEDARAPLRELIPFLRDPDPEVRARAALAAARSLDPGAADLLRAAAADGDPAVRAAAALGMGLTDDGTLAGDALDLARRDGSPEAAAATARLAGKDGLARAEAGGVFRSTAAAARRAAWRALVGAVRGWKEKQATAPPWLLEGLGDPDPEVRQAAALLHRSFPHGEEADAALARLAAGDPDPEVRASAAIAVAPGFAGQEPALIDALAREPVARVRAAIVRGLGQGKGESSLAALHAALADPHFVVRAAAADFLGVRAAAAGASDPAAEEALAAVAASDVAVLPRVAAVESLQKLAGPRAERAVLRASRDGNPYVRAAAAGPRLPLEDLDRLTGDPEVRVREAAVSEAGERGRLALPIVLRSLGDPDPVVASGAAAALGEMGATEATGALLAALARAAAPARAPDDAADLRAAALKALGKLGAPGAGDLAGEFLGDPDPGVREAAGGILADAGGKPPVGPVPPRLLPFLDRADLRTRSGGAPRVRFETDRGSFVVETDPAAAPVHVARLLARVRAGGYDGTVMHRIVPNFVVQGGDPRGDGSGNGGACTRQEFSGRPYLRGTLGVPRSTPPDSGGCQLFFCHASTPHLDQRYTVMGRIVEGVAVLDDLDLGDRILRARVE